jgi:hypothetical protein
MQIAERSPTYGSHFYAVCDKAGASWLLGINSRGICQYSVDDITVAKKASRVGVCYVLLMGLSLIKGAFY